MLTAADLEVNVLDFRERTFQFDRLVDVGRRTYAVFSRTETESERQLRPKLVHLTVVVPLEEVILDEASDALRIGRPRTGTVAPGAAAVEVAAEPPEFEEGGLRWKRVALGSSSYAYVLLDLADTLLSREGRAGLGLP